MSGQQDFSLGLSSMMPEISINETGHEGNPFTIQAMLEKLGAGGLLGSFGNPEVIENAIAQFPSLLSGELPQQLLDALGPEAIQAMLAKKGKSSALEGIARFGSALLTGAMPGSSAEYGQALTASGEPMERFRDLEATAPMNAAVQMEQLRQGSAQNAIQGGRAMTGMIDSYRNFMNMKPEMVMELIKQMPELFKLTEDEIPMLGARQDREREGWRMEDEAHAAAMAESEAGIDETRADTAGTLSENQIKALEAAAAQGDPGAISRLQILEQAKEGGEDYQKSIRESGRTSFTNLIPRWDQIGRDTQETPDFGEVFGTVTSDIPGRDIEPVSFKTLVEKVGARNANLLDVGRSVQETFRRMGALSDESAMTPFIKKVKVLNDRLARGEFPSDMEQARTWLVLADITDPTERQQALAWIAYRMNDYYPLDDEAVLQFLKPVSD